MSAARRRKKLVKHGYVGGVTGARYDRRFEQMIARRAFFGILGYQAPVKYNRCKHCGYQRHCPPDLVDMKIAQGKTGKRIA